MILALVQVLALEGATVHSMVPEAPPVVATVLVEDGRFLAVGAELEIPAEAIRVDLSGKHIIPGLIDGMVHHDMEHDLLYVLHGVTLARDMGNDLGRIFVNALPNSRDAMPGPALLVAGAIFDGNPPATTEAVVVRDAAEVEGKLPRLLELGAQFASYHTGLPGPAWAQLLASAEQSGVQVWGPLPAGLTLERVVTSGQDGVCYLEGFLTDDGSFDEALARERAALFAENDVAAMPLLHVYGYRAEDQGEDPPIFNYLAPWYADWWRADLQQRRARFDEDYLAKGAEEYQRKQWLVRALYEAGAALVPGSAAPNPWMAPGLGLHDELEAWVAAGIPDAAVLRFATAGAAEALGIDAERGTIEAGKIADAVILSADPAADVRALRAPEGVVLRGSWMDAESLGRLRQALLAAQLEASAKALAPIPVTKPELPEGRVVLTGRVVGKAFDRTTSAEEYWVVRCFEGDTAWVSRMVTPAGVGKGESEQTLIQRFDDKGRLTSFRLEMLNGGQVYKVEGQQISGQFRIKRWVSDSYIDTNSSPSRPDLVDVGMSLGPMLIANYIDDGTFVTLYFDGMDPALGGWECKRGDNGVLAVKTAEGPLVATFEPNGAVARIARTLGQATVHYESEGSDSFGGPGVPPRRFPEPPGDAGEAPPGEGGAGGSNGDER